MKTAHVSPHLGGGVGRVLLNYLCRVSHEAERHIIYCLDYANEEAKARAKAEGLELHDNMSLGQAALSRALAKADIVVVHWWNHPLLYAWLINGVHPPSRLLLWSHVSGFSAPQIITPALTAFPDIFAAASPCSFKVPALAALSPNEKKEKLRLIFSCAGLEHVASARPRPHDAFRIGYLGTVDYAKMHPDFIGMSLAADIPEAVFPVAGGPAHKEFAAEAAAAGADGKFEVLGPIKNVAEFLSGLDVFGYPLNPDHYGTGEQTLIEAQAVGIPPVVLAGGAEEFVIEHGRTGLAAKDAADYSRCLESLARNRELRLRLSDTAYKRARERFSLDSTVNAFAEIYRELMDRPKNPKKWPGRAGAKVLASPWEIFISSQGDLGDEFRRMGADLRRPGIQAASPEAREAFLAGLGQASCSDTRGSVLHYRSFFPDDPFLNYCGELLSGRPTPESSPHA